MALRARACVVAMVLCATPCAALAQSTDADAGSATPTPTPTTEPSASDAGVAPPPLATSTEATVAAPPPATAHVTTTTTPLPVAPPVVPPVPHEEGLHRGFFYVQAEGGLSFVDLAAFASMNRLIPTINQFSGLGYSGGGVGLLAHFHADVALHL